MELGCLFGQGYLLGKPEEDAIWGHVPLV